MEAAVKLVIKRDGKVITGTQSVIVGQKISLSGAVQGGGSIATQPAPSWSIEGTKVGGWAVTSTSARVLGVATNKSSVNFHWVSGGTYSVTLSAMVKGARRTASVKFNVYRPNVGLKVSYSKTDPQVTGRNNPPAMSVAFKMKFTASPSGGAGALRGGSIVWCQLVKGAELEVLRQGTFAQGN